MFRTLVVAFIFLFVSNSQAAVSPLEYQEQMFEVGAERYRVALPKGYVLELMTDELDGPRIPIFLENGDLLIGSKSGKVYRFKPPYTKPQVLLKLRDYPHSVAFNNGYLYVAQEGGLYRAPYALGQEKISKKSLALISRLPTGGHSSRTVAVGPDGRIYLSIGISGNCSDEYLGDEYDFDDRRGGVWVLDESGTKLKLKTFASGLRNPVGFAWHPKTKEMYSSNNGPDHLGFQSPPEYFSRLLPDSFHGMPWFQYDGKKIFRDECISREPPRPIEDVVPPVATFPARNAPMGVTFVPENSMHKVLIHDAIVALRGSWGTRPSGSFWGDASTRRTPRLVAVRFENGEAQQVDDLLTGFQLSDGDRWARPVGVAIGPDGALYFTSDSGVNGLFRLRYIGGH